LAARATVFQQRYPPLQWMNFKAVGAGRSSLVTPLCCRSRRTPERAYGLSRPSGYGQEPSLSSDRAPGIGNDINEKSAPKGAPISSKPKNREIGHGARISAAILATVALPVPSNRAVFRMPAPAAREARTASSRSALIFGLPNAFPLLVPSRFARAMPARTRSTIRLRSNSAKTPSILSHAKLYN
jgi:hypothetical protein